jgi:hypothetical protein
VGDEKKGETEMATEAKQVTIKAPNLQVAEFKIIGNAPLVVHRFSAKAKNMMLDKMKAGTTARGKKVREAFDTKAAFNEARYVSAGGWDGFNAAAIRHALISACRLVGFKMTLAKLSVFVLPDGWDELEPQIPLIRIFGKARILESTARVETGQAYVTVRPCYDKWHSVVKIQFDGDQFTLGDVSNLLSRAGQQFGICEGRPDSKNSAGMGWGTFTIANK